MPDFTLPLVGGADATPSPIGGAYVPTSPRTFPTGKAQEAPWRAYFDSLPLEQRIRIAALELALHTNDGTFPLAEDAVLRRAAVYAKFIADGRDGDDD